MNVCHASRPRAAGCWLGILFIPVVVCVVLSRNRLDFALFPDVSDTPVLKWISGPFLTEKINEFTNWFVDRFDTFTIAFKNDITNWLLNPLAGPARPVALVAHGERPAGGRVRARRLATDGDHAGLRGRHPRHRPLERHHDHAGDDPGRDASW